MVGTIIYSNFIRDDEAIYIDSSILPWCWPESSMRAGAWKYTAFVRSFLRGIFVVLPSISMSRSTQCKGVWVKTRRFHKIVAKFWQPGVKSDPVGALRNASSPHFLGCTNWSLQLLCRQLDAFPTLRGGEVFVEAALAASRGLAETL